MGQGVTGTPPQAAPPTKTPWTLERTLGVLNLSLIIIAGILAAIGWFPKWGEEKLAYAARLQTPTVPSSDFKVSDLGSFKDGTHCYNVEYNVSTKNQSDRAVSITYSVAELYLGDRQLIPLQASQAYEMNDPPNLWDASGHGQINWHLITYDASQIDGGAPKEVVAFFAQLRLSNLSPGGGMTGVLSPGDATGEDPQFIVRAHPEQYVGLSVSYGIDNETKSPSPKINLTSDFKHFSDAKLADSSSSKEAQEYCGPAKPA
jgi:hypothetical protein